MAKRSASMISPVAMTALLLRSWPPASIFDADGCGRLHSWMDGCCSMPAHRGASTTLPCVGELRGPLRTNGGSSKKSKHDSARALTRRFSPCRRRRHRRNFIHSELVPSLSPPAHPPPPPVSRKHGRVRVMSVRL